MEIFEIAVRRQAQGTPDAVELRARVTVGESVSEALAALDTIIYAHLNITPSVPAPTIAEEEVQDAVEATEHDTPEIPALPVKAKRKYTRKESAPALPVMQEMAVELPLAAEDFVPVDTAPQAAIDLASLPTVDPVVGVVDLSTPTVAPAIDFDLLAMDEEPAPQPAVVNVAKLKVPEVKYKGEPQPEGDIYKQVAADILSAPQPAVTGIQEAPEVTDPLKLQKRIQDAIASRVISPEPVLSLMHARGFNSTRETDEACRIAILELIIAAEAKK